MISSSRVACHFIDRLEIIIVMQRLLLSSFKFKGLRKFLIIVISRPVFNAYSIRYNKCQKYQLILIANTDCYLTRMSVKMKCCKHL